MRPRLPRERPELHAAGVLDLGCCFLVSSASTRRLRAAERLLATLYPSKTTPARAEATEHPLERAKLHAEGLGGCLGTIY
jgi:hypothetical protein